MKRCWVERRKGVDKPNCWKCKHRSLIPGSAHSRCLHPSAKSVVTPVSEKGLSVKIARGWFNWPFKFDPGWLLECDGFEAREEE